MRIAYLLADPGIGIFGVKGASVHAQEMIRAFRRMGHEVTVYCLKRGSRAGDSSTESVPEDLRDLPVFTAAVTGAKGAADRELAVLRAASRLATLASEVDYELIYERYSLFSDAGVQLARQLRARNGEHVPLVMEINAPLVQEQRTHRSLHHQELAEQVTAKALGQADLLSCVSEDVASWAWHQGGQQAGPRVVITPNGVDTERFGPKWFPQSSGRGHRPFTVGFVGTLKPWHGTTQLIEAFAVATNPQRRSWRLEIVGDGPQRDQLSALAVQLGVRDQVVFHGAQQPHRIPQLLQRFDVAVAPYPPANDDAHYFSPLKVYEYLAAGLPVVASAVGELPALLDNAGHPCGLLVKPGDAWALSESLDRLASDEALRAELGYRGRQAACEQHSWTSRAHGMLAAVPETASVGLRSDSDDDHALRVDPGLVDPVPGRVSRV